MMGDSRRRSKVESYTRREAQLRHGIALQDPCMAPPSRKGVEATALRRRVVNGLAVWCLFGLATAHAQVDDFRVLLASGGTSSAGSFGAGDPEMARSETVGGEFGVRSRDADCWDDPPPDAAVHCHPKSREGDQTHFGIVHRDADGIETPTTTEFTYSYSTVERTATEGVDYEGVSGTLTMKVGDSRTPVLSIRLLDDALDEPQEIFAIHVLADSAPPFEGLPGVYIVKTIVDNDDPPSVSIEDDSGLEDSVGKLSFDVKLDAESGKEITLEYATADDTATAGSDYTQTNGTLTFSAGETTKTIDVPVLEDDAPEEDETFTVTLSDAVKVTIGDGTGTGTIRNDDPVPASLSIEDVVAVESREALEFPVTLSGDREEGTTVTVDYATANRTAEAGSDYTETTGTLTFATDVTRQTIQVPILDDVIDETHEIFVVGLSNAMGATISDALAEGKILDDDVIATGVTLKAAPARVSEDDGETDIAVTATLNGVWSGAIEVTVSVAGSGDADAVDFDEVRDFTIMIAAGASSGAGTFTLTPEDDNVDESDETLSVTGTSDLPVTATEVELADDDATSSNISLTAEPPRVSEGDGATPVRVMATLDAGARTVETTITVTVSGSGSADAVDFADVRDFTITIAEGDTSGTGSFTLTPEDDNVDESDETINIDGSSDLTVTADTVALADDDNPSAAILLSASPGRIPEDGGAAPIQVTATLDASARAVATTVSVSVAGRGRPDAVDYAATPTSFDITIAAGATTGTETFTVTPEDDEVDERNEVLDIAGASDLPVTPTSVTLADDDQTSTEIVLSAAPSTVSEGAGATPIEVTATLDAGARTVPTTVTVEVTGSGDPDAVDFASVRDLKIMIAAGATSGRWTFTLTPDDDNVAESSETLTVDGTADLPVTETTVTLTDDDVASDRIVLSASPSRVSEDGGAVGVRVTASLNGAVRQTATTVTVSVAGSGNSRAVDFQAVADFEIIIAANAASGAGTFTLTPVDDGAVEADETLTVSGMSADLPVTPTTVTLADDDDASTRILLSAVPGRVSEGDGPTPVTVTATLDRALRQQATTVAVSVSGSGDAGAADFAAVADFAITIEANAASGTGTFTLTPQDDETVEANERLTVSGVSDLPVTPASVTLVDDDEASTRILLFLTVDPPRASEGDGEIRVTVTAEVDKGVRPDETRIAVSVEGSGDADAVDFDPIPDFDVVIPANAPEGTGTFTVVPEDDLIVEADEVLTISGVADLPVTPATMELLDDDEASTRILLSADPARVSEGGGPVAVTVTATLDRGLRREATTVAVSVAGGGDPDAVDFDAVADFRITIEANAPSGTGTFTLTPEDDAEDEADETLALTGESDLPVTPASVVLADDDEMMVSRVLSIADAEAVEGAGEVRFAVTLDGPSAAEVTVDYETADPAGFVDPVAEADIDYENVAGTLTFAPGEVSRTIRVQVLDDDLDEPDETFALVLSDPRGATLGRGSALGTIRDDDEPPALSIAGDTGPEDVGELVFSVTLTARALTEVTVNYATMDDTAIAGDDYVPVEGTLTFAPGETAKSIRVAVVDDAVDEADEEVFAVTLSGHSGATLAHALATGVIRDNDEPPALSVADAAGDEDVGTLDFAVTLSAPSGIEVSASYATKDGTAAADSDYAAATGTLVFAPGEVSRTIRVAILDDALHEADEETFEMTLARLVNASAADVSATGTIRDNDLAPPSVAGDLPAALLCVGGAPYELDLADYFAGKELRFSAVSSTPLVATAALDGSRLTVAPASEGESSVTVTATNDAGSASGSIGVRVVADPAELEAVESVLASIGRAVLTGVTESIRARFDPGSAFGEQGASPIAGGNRAQVVPDAGAVVGNHWAGPAMRGAGSGGWDGSGLFEPQVPGDDWFETMNRTYRRGMVPFSFSLDSAQSPSTDPAWAVWGRADAHRFESGIDGNSHDGTLTAVHLGADARVGDWLAGISVARSAADADYRFERSVDACGVGGVGDGMVDAELTSVHPYAGRRIGRGSVWATLGAGGGEVSVERCETGQRNETDLSMRLAALGGRHPFAGGERIEVSVVEEISVLDLTTGDAVGPVGDRSVRVGQARLGLEATGVATPGCNCSLTTFVRGFARGDWGDGATGAGLELAAGVRFRNLPRRLGIDAGIRALAMHSAEDARERSANLTFSILPKADGTGWRASLAWRRGASDARLAALGGDSPWTAPSGRLPGAELQWIAQSRLGYGIGLRRGSATPFVELDAGPGRGGARFGVRHEFGDRARGLVVEWGIEQSGFASAGNRIVLEALGRF